MAPALPCRPKLRLLCVGVALAFLLGVDVGRADIYKDIQIIWSADHTYYFMDGDSEALALSLDFNRGSAFKSNDMYLFARIDLDIKLVEGNSAGTVCTVYDRGGRRDDPVVRQQRGAGRAVPVVAAAAGVREPVERRRLGDAGRARQDGLVAGALRLLLPQLQHHLLPAVAGGVVVRRRARRVPALQPLPQGARRPAVGAQHGLRHLRLLHRHEQPVHRHQQAQGVLAPAPPVRNLISLGLVE
uniref:Xyloglucan endotransglucosylase/hydrolase n=1 Tax=Triticum aestivum TaxID=4565 RepID=A0A3B6CEE6_WHEAT